MAWVLRLLVLLVTAGLVRATPLDALRVYSVQRDCFEFMFMSTMGAGKSAKLVFNHVDGATHIVTVGEQLGDYTVESYTPIINRVFNESINAYQKHKTGQVRLRDKQGETIDLEMEKPLNTDTWTACLVAKDSGAYKFVTPGEKLVIDNALIEIATITEEQACMRLADRVQPIDWANEREREELQELWNERRKQREVDQLLQQRVVAEREEEEEKAVLPTRRVLPVQGREHFVTRQHQPRATSSHFGTDFPYPTEYSVIPVIVQLPNGQKRVRPIIVPTRFSRRSVGFSVTPRY